MRPDVNTCPDCGALITPQLTKCRQCGRYLHGTKLEGILFEHLLPESLRASPGTGMLMLMNLLYYALMVVLAGFGSAIAFTSFSLSQLGSTSTPEILQGEYWRFVTSMLAHHDVVHIAFNLYALATLGRLVEEAFDKKKMMIIYLVSGAASMALSFVWRVYVLGGIGSSVGASGAVCGMLGAGLVGAHRLGSIGSEVKKSLIRWGVYLIIWGLVVSGIDNAAHIGGFVVGAGLAYVTPLGMVQSVSVNRILSVVLLGLLGGVAFCVSQMLLDLRGYPASLESDAEPRRALFFTVSEGENWDYSSQRLLFQDCQELLQKDPVSEHTQRTCELARRANPYEPDLYRVLAQIHAAQGDEQSAEVMRSTGERLHHLVRRAVGM